MRKHVRILEVDRVNSTSGADLGIAHQPKPIIQPPARCDEPIDLLSKELDPLAFRTKASDVRYVPAHAKPPGLVGPAGRSGKLSGAAGDDAGLRRLAAAADLTARATESSLPAIPFSAVS